MTPPRRPTADYPAAAYTKAIRAFDEFDACTAEYRLMLDTHRALLISDNFDGIVQTMLRGDGIARRAAACSRSIAPVREGLATGGHIGPRATELRARLTRASAAAELLGSSIAQVSAACVVKRETASKELGENQRAAARPGLGYAPTSRPATSIDIRY